MNLVDRTAFQDKLLSWYDSSARVLPWRDNPTPYRVWISEIMLQQTRVETVKPYFENFMSHLPTVEDLSTVNEEKLLKLWEGLGYYSRARNLKKAAIKIMEDMNGQIPSNEEDLRSLPGIGPYTSGAIASIAFHVRATAVDGNVLRVIARITANTGDIKNQAIKKEIENTVIKLLPDNRVGDFNQGLMELGATVCIPNGKPKCSDCPVNTLCHAHMRGIADTIPLKSKKKKRKIEEKTVFLMAYKDTIALRQRSELGLLSNLWEFPNVDGHLTLKEVEEELRKEKFDHFKIIPLNKSKHIFSHIEWHMIGYFIGIEKPQDYSKLIWASKEEVENRYSIPTAFQEYQKYLELIEKESLPNRKSTKK